MPSFVAAWHYLRQQGVATALWRAKYVLSRRTGLWQRRFPAFDWSERPLSYWVKADCPSISHQYKDYRQQTSVRFFFGPGKLPKVDKALTELDVPVADAGLAGRFLYFSHQWGDLGNPPDWLLNPFTGVHFDARHWCDREDLDPTLGDIKYIWEPSRFGWVFSLVRAYSATGHDDYPAQFWRLLESWCESNPPQRGPNWQCGQECAFRLLAAVFGLYAFWSSPETADERIAHMAVFIASHAERIAGNIDFARSLRNNHVVTEAAGLYTAGLLFPEFKEAHRWRALGKSILEHECLEQFYSDGSYIQHSFNYQRLVLELYTWVLALARANQDEFRLELLEALDRSVSFLWHVQDEPSGRVPNYGSNDGAWFLPLSSCSYLDYRPALSALHYALHNSTLYTPGPWDEPIRWLFGEGAPSRIPVLRDRGGEPTLGKAPADSQPNTVRPSLHAASGGYYTLRGRESWAMIRCHSYRDRPAQADMLHLDLWWKGINVLRDAGTYSYNCPEPWRSHFVATSAHNTLVVDGEDQMRRGERFMWYDWTKAQIEYHQLVRDGEIEYWQGRHAGYGRLGSPIIHRRAVLRLGDSEWHVIDQVQTTEPRKLELFWHLPDLPYRAEGHKLMVQSHEGPIGLTSMIAGVDITIFRARENEPLQGWESLRYGERLPRLTVRMSGSTTIDSEARTVLHTTLTLGEPESESVKLGDYRRASKTDEPLITSGTFQGSDFRIDPYRRVSGNFWPPIA